MSRNVAAICIAVALTLGSWGMLGGQGFAASTGTLTIGVPVDINTLDPSMAPEATAENVSLSAMEPLLYLDPKENIKPRLAESWQVIDKVTYVFHLRHGVKFTNGELLTGKAVEFSWRRSAEPNRTGLRAALRSVARVEHIDDYTIRVTTDKPDPIFLKKMAAAAGAIVPPEYVTEKGDEAFALHPVGTGPFTLVEWVKGDHVTFRANPNYYLPNVPRVQTVVWRSIPEPASRVAALQTGQIDIALRLPAQQAATLRNDPNIRLSNALATRTFRVSFNNMTTGKGTPIMDSRVRLALNLGVDRQAIIKSIYNGQAEQVNSLIGNVQFGHDPTLAPLPYDPARAKRLLAEAGYPQGFKVGMACPSGAYANDKEACEAVAGYLVGLGLQIELQVMEPNRFFDLESKRQTPPLYFDGNGDRFQDADLPLRGMLMPEFSSFSAFEKQEFVDLVVTGGSTLDAAERRQVYARLSRAMQADPPAIFLWQIRNFEGVRKRVLGYTTRPTESMSHVPFEVSVTQ
jgi:peptide/nickel transport system substrate-binding protein